MNGKVWLVEKDEKLFHQFTPLITCKHFWLVPPKEDQEELIIAFSNRRGFFSPQEIIEYFNFLLSDAYSNFRVYHPRCKKLNKECRLFPAAIKGKSGNQADILLLPFDKIAHVFMAEEYIDTAICPMKESRRGEETMPALEWFCESFDPTLAAIVPEELTDSFFGPGLIPTIRRFIAKIYLPLSFVALIFLFLAFKWGWTKRIYDYLGL